MSSSLSSVITYFQYFRSVSGRISLLSSQDTGQSQDKFISFPKYGQSVLYVCYITDVVIAPQYGERVRVANG